MGAGAAGVPAAISAKEAGATVALIQKEATAISQGNTATGILLDGSDPAGVSAVVSTLLKEHQFRGNRAQVELWAKNSGEAITRIFELAQKVGAQVSDTTKKWTSTVQTVNDYPMSYLSIGFGPKPYNTGDGMRVLADYAEEQGVDIFYNTEAKQLVGDADSGITGVIAKGADGSTFEKRQPRRTVRLFCTWGGAAALCIGQKIGLQFLRPVEAFSRISRANVRGGDAWIHTYPGRPGAVLLRSRRRATP